MKQGEVQDTYSYRIVIEPDENGYFHAYVPALPGCHTWGNSVDETRKNARDAIFAYISSLIDDGENIPEDRGIEVIETLTGVKIPKKAVHA